MLELENTHNTAGGTVLSPEQTQALADVAHAGGAKVHLDGARIFNAAVALGVDARELTAGADSVTFCLSKGLSAPVGSVVCGSREFIYEARRARKVLGGGMRQAGVIAAAGIVALTEMVDRLAEDHAHAKRLAEGIADTPGLWVDPARIQTNIVFFEVHRDGMTPVQLAARLKEEGVWLLAQPGRRLRAVTHYGITAEDIEEALGALRRVMAGT